MFLFVEGLRKAGLAEHVAEGGVGVGLAEIGEGDAALLEGLILAGAAGETGLLRLAIFGEGGEPFRAGGDVHGAALDGDDAGTAA